MGSIFLSHVEKDLENIQQLVWGLQAAGYCTRYFKREVLTGMIYLIQISFFLIEEDQYEF